MLAVYQAGMQAILVKIGAGDEGLGKYRHKWLKYVSVHIVQNISVAVGWLLKNNKWRKVYGI